MKGIIFLAQMHSQILIQADVVSLEHVADELGIANGIMVEEQLCLVPASDLPIGRRLSIEIVEVYPVIALRILNVDQRLLKNCR